MPDALDRYRRRGKSSAGRAASQTKVLMILVVAGLVVAVGLAAALLSGNGASPQRPSKSPAERSSRQTSSKSGSQRRKPGWRGGTAIPRGPRTLADLVQQDAASPETGQGPIDNGTLTVRLELARLAMSRRDLEAAREQVRSADEMAASPTEQKETRRVQALLESLDSFWQAVRFESSRLRPGEQLAVRGKAAEVVRYGDAELTISVAGKSYVYTLEDMPPSLAVFLAERGLPGGDPRTNLHVGSFHAVDVKGDRVEARRRWQQAGEPGKALMPELEMAPPGEGP